MEMIEITYRTPRKEKKWPEPKLEDLIADIECKDFTDEYRKYCRESFYRRTGKHYEPGAKIEKPKKYFSDMIAFCDSNWRTC